MRDRLRSLARRREAAYVVMGGLTTVVGLTTFAVLYTLFPDTLHYLGALVLAYAVGIGLGFHLQRTYTFKVRGRLLGDFVRYAGVQAAGFGLNAALLALLVEVVHLPVLLSQVLAQTVTVVSTYVAHTLFSFRRTHQPDIPGD